ncbi:MAG: CBS domain-containing protein [Anaerolineales bacterium]|nr:CBS domain-containing protein [Chloroflexota bacterium]MBL6981133.1 CBS domain-containing protein [Anaerolineales bacterium]
MLVGDRMSHPVITISADLPIIEAVNLMRREHIRRTPVIKDGKLVGIVSDQDLLNASPSPATSLSIWEMNYLLSKITVEDVMTSEVLTIETDCPIEEAARIMVDNKIGGLPVMKDDRVVGVITETDIFKVFLELMGARDLGVRITALIPEKLGQLAALTKAVTEAGGNFISFGVTAGDDPANSKVTFKVNEIDEAKVSDAIQPFVEKIEDIRTSSE